MDALDLTAERLNRLRLALTKVAEDSRARADYYDEHGDPEGRPVRQDGQRAHRPQQPDPRRGPQAGR
ncbi:hypothetical protein ACODT5_03790 [Streptomyces sp. 5.8]|uniref:hypothetical protein n=1 Tax=Streptomyces sp. 5.8 TaxID=3406571 RepID=UPI003BB4E76A